MEVSKNALRKETVATLNEIEAQLKEHSDPYLRIPLLLAKTQCLNTITLLNT